MHSCLRRRQPFTRPHTQGFGKGMRSAGHLRHHLPIIVSLAHDAGGGSEVSDFDFIYGDNNKCGTSGDDKS